MPIFTDEPTDLKPNTVVSVPVGKSTKVSSPTEPTVIVQNRDSERQFRTQEEMKTSLLFDKDTPLRNVTANIRGMKWEVDYFAQIRNINDPTAAPDIQLSNTVQKYNRINNLVLFVQNAISQAMPGEISGEAYINAGMVPNKDDIFKATLTSGRECIFIVTDVVNNTYNLHKAFLITYKALFFLDANVNLYNNIKLKVAKTYNYNKNYLKDYSSPIVLPEEYEDIINLNVVRRNIIDYYLKTFISNADTSSVLHIPTVMRELAIDPYLDKFFFKIVSTEDNIKLRDITRIDVPIEDGMIYTIWDLILDRRPSNFPITNNTLGWGYLDYRNNTYVSSRNIIYMGVKSIVRPGGDISLRVMPNVRDTLPEEYKVPIIHTDKYTYVFGEYFYKREAENCGVLERATLNFIKGKSISREMLTRLLTDYPYWPLEDQYYGIPILLVLLKDFLNNAYKDV